MPERRPASPEDFSKLTAHPYHIVVAHRRKQRQGHRLASDSRRDRRVLRAIPEVPIIFEAGNAGIVYSDADAAIGHDFLECRPRDAARPEIDEQLKHMPAMTRVAACRQYHARKALEFFEIARGQSAAPRVESVQSAQ